MSTVTTPSRRRFNDEMKLQAVRLVREQKLPVVQICRDFNISSSSLHRWLSQHDAECDGRTGSGAPITPEQRRIRELERENRLLRQDVDILKKHPPSSPGSWHDSVTNS